MKVSSEDLGHFSLLRTSTPRSGSPGTRRRPATRAKRGSWERTGSSSCLRGSTRHRYPASSTMISRMVRGLSKLERGSRVAANTTAPATSTASPTATEAQTFSADANREHQHGYPDRDEPEYGVVVDEAEGDEADAPQHREEHPKHAPLGWGRHSGWRSHRDGLGIEWRGGRGGAVEIDDPGGGRAHTPIIPHLRAASALFGPRRVPNLARRLALVLALPEELPDDAAEPVGFVEVGEMASAFEQD
jgi:hypothetical protein